METNEILPLIEYEFYTRKERQGKDKQLPNLPAVWREAFASFLAGERSETTVRNYIREAGYFLLWWKLTYKHGPTAATSDQLATYKEHMRAKRTRQGAAEQLRGAWRFYEAARLQGLIPINPADDMVRTKKTSGEHVAARSYVPLDQLKTLLELDPAGEPTDLARLRLIRDRLIISLMAMHGLAVGEVARLELVDVDEDAGAHGALQVRGRGERARVVDLVDRTASFLRAWLVARADPLLRVPSGETALFVATRRSREDLGTAMTARAIQEAVTQRLQAARVKTGAGDGVTCQALRASAAAWGLAGGADEDETARMLGIRDKVSMRPYTETARQAQRNPAAVIERLIWPDSKEG